MSCTLATTIVAATSAAPITLTVGVSAAATGSITNVPPSPEPNPDPVPGNNSGSDTTAVSVSYDLGLTKSLIGALHHGADATYRLVVINIGPADAPTGVTVIDTLPTGETFVSASAQQWIYTAAILVVTCVAGAAITTGNTATIDVTVHVDALAGATVPNRATVIGLGGEVNPSNNSSAVASAVLAASTTVPVPDSGLAPLLRIGENSVLLDAGGTRHPDDAASAGAPTALSASRFRSVRGRSVTTQA